MAQHVVDYDMPRQRIPVVIDWYNRQPLPQSYHKRIAFLRDRALLNVMFFTAARLEEVRSINYDQVVDGQLQLIVTGKGGKSRTIHIDEQCQEQIQAYLKMRDDAHEALFVPHSGNTDSNRLSRKIVWKIVKRAFQHLKLHEALSPHDIRHYRATDLLRRGMKLHELQEFLGHASIATTRDIYAPVLGADKIASALHSLGR